MQCRFRNSGTWRLMQGSMEGETGSLAEFAVADAILEPALLPRFLLRNAPIWPVHGRRMVASGRERWPPWSGSPCRPSCRAGASIEQGGNRADVSRADDREWPPVMAHAPVIILRGHTDLHAQGMRPRPARARLWTKLPVWAAGCSGSLSPRWWCPAARRGSVADGSVDHVSVAGGATGAHHRAASPGAV